MHHYPFMRLTSMNLNTVVFVVTVLAMLPAGAPGDDFRPDRCEVLPLLDHQVSFSIDGVEKLRWHFGDQYPRPFFYPFNGPSGVSLTRMGHPGAQNHDHHRSVWFAHHKLNGVDFWSDNTRARVRQKHWYRYRDGSEEAVMASLLGWFDEGGKEVMEQDVIAALRPMDAGEHALELQITMRPPQGVDTVMLGKTNFGLLAVRVSKTLSEYFGGGQLSNSEGVAGEPGIFGKRARWMDYSGPVVVGTGEARHLVCEGITYFDHPDNPRYPTYWHVREDGWMGASFGMQEEWRIDRQNPLVLRYLLHAHSGEYDHDKAEDVQQRFAKRPGFQIRQPNADERHRQYEVERITVSNAVK
ncbi:MAG: PmoA family protein [Fuerstiella sp.]|nr:PmoA family protein [Fuerstiella sp.]